MNKQRSVTLLIAVSVLLFAVTTFAYNLTYFRQYCYSAYDLGIYMEAFQKFSLSNWNPFLSTLGVGFLNDHWHPALLLAKIPAIVFSTSTSLFLTEIAFVILASLVPLYLVKEKLLRFDLAALICFYLVLNQREFEAAMGFPVHPAVWANFILLLATALIIKKTDEIFIFSLLWFAGFFGEQFSFCVLGYASAYLLQHRKIRHFFPLIFSIFWVWFCISGRSYLIGPILHQTDRVAFSFETFISKYRWDLAQLKNTVKFFVEALPLFYVAWKGRRFLQLEKSSGLLIAGIFLPLIAGRILSGSFGHQYDTLLVASVGALGLWLFARSDYFSLSPGFLTGVVIFFCLMSYPKFEQAFGVITEKKLQNCIHTKDVATVAPLRFKELSSMVDDALTVAPREIFAQGNLVPNLVEKFPQAEVICLGMPSRGGKTPDWIIIERGVCGDPWPFDRGSLEAKKNDLLIQFPELKKVKQSDCTFSAHRE